MPETTETIVTKKYEFSVRDEFFVVEARECDFCVRPTEQSGWSIEMTTVETQGRFETFTDLGIRKYFVCSCCGVISSEFEPADTDS